MVAAPSTSSFSGHETGYLAVSESAKASLYFLLPFIVLYELGTWYWTFDPLTNTEQRIVAFSLWRDSLAALGATARWVAPAGVVSVLIGLILVRREKVRLSGGIFLGMVGESAVLAFPLILLGMLLARINWPLLARGGGLSSVGPDLILSIGAGIYEEFLFRLIGFAVLHFVLSDFLSLRPSIASAGMVLISGIVFSLYHYWGPEPFQMQTFVFRSVAGCYFGGIMLVRGFGITAGSHASYDILISLLRVLSHDI